MGVLTSVLFWCTIAAAVAVLLSHASLKLIAVDPLDRALARLFPQPGLRNRLIGGGTVVAAVTVVWAAFHHTQRS